MTDKLIDILCLFFLNINAANKIIRSKKMKTQRQNYFFFFHFENWNGWIVLVN